MAISVRFEVDAVVAILREKVGRVGSSESESFARSDVRDSIITILKAMSSSLRPVLARFRTRGERHTIKEFAWGRLSSTAEAEMARRARPSVGRCMMSLTRVGQTGWRNKVGGTKGAFRFSATAIRILFSHRFAGTHSAR